MAADGHDGADSPATRIAVDPLEPDADVLASAGALIRSGALVAFPTETVYGLGAHALDRRATAAIFEAKGRPSTDPLIVHVADVEQARGLTASWSTVADRLSEKFWPGPLTLVLHKSSEVPDEITANRNTVAVRIPRHAVAHGLLVAAGVPVAAPSANRFGRISPTSASDVESELSGRYDLLLDAGPTQVGVESTVLDLTGERPVLLRPGGVTTEQIEDLIGPIVKPERRSHREDEDAVAPGQFLRHYSPRTPLVCVSGTEELFATVVEGLQAQGIAVRVLQLPGSSTEAASRLYSTLRSADGGSQILAIRTVNPEGLGRAINDRLYRAAQGFLITEFNDRTVESVLSLMDSTGT